MATVNPHSTGIVLDLLSYLKRINQIASPNPTRTLGDCADDLMLVTDLARAAIAKAIEEPKP